MTPANCSSGLQELHTINSCCDHCEMRHGVVMHSNRVVAKVARGEQLVAALVVAVQHTTTVRSCTYSTHESSLNTALTCMHKLHVALSPEGDHL